MPSLFVYVLINVLKIMKKGFLALVLYSIFISGCVPHTSGQYAYRLPKKIDDGFDVGSPDEVKMDVELIESAVDDISSGKYGEIHSMLIYKDNKLVFEEYFPGYDYQWDSPNFHGAWVDWSRDTEHNIHSVGKSITSACIGIAVDKGFIESVNQSIFDYLPEHQHLNTNGKDQITIEHLLTMISGLEWDEWDTPYSDQNNDVIALWIDCDDPLSCILGKPLVSLPGTDFNYSGGDMILLGEIIKSASGMDIEAFSAEYLFAPMGIKAPEWRWIKDSDVVFASGDQKMTPREMLKFGAAYLNDGTWNGRRIIPDRWVEQSANSYPAPDNSWFNHFLRPIPPGDTIWGHRGYSYTWWTHEFSHSGKTFSAYWAFGWGGQKIVIFPDQNTVVVFTGGNYTSADTTAKIITKYLIPSFK